jgi:Uma2 family endonuclease
MAALAESVGWEELTFAGLHLPVTVRLSAPMTDQELIAFSHRHRPYRMEQNANGELEIMSPLGFQSGQREMFTCRMLGNWANEHGGVCASPDTGFRLADDAVRCPDASWISDARAAALTEAQQRGFAPVCPEVLIEILSETDRRTTLEAKLEMWMANGAQLAWMIDPYAATVSIYRAGAGVEVLERPEVVEAGEPVAGFRLVMERLWDKA